jgi:ubiquinone/menaquinone biosynthesis C-methylase UbiE
VLDIGCGSGVMTCWIAQQVGDTGHVIGIENNENQLQAAKKRAHNASLKNAEFKLCSAYDLESLNEKFDFIYCRFVLHHLHKPDEVIFKIFNELNL